MNIRQQLEKLASYGDHNNTVLVPVERQGALSRFAHEASEDLASGMTPHKGLGRATGIGAGIGGAVGGLFAHGAGARGLGAHAAGASVGAASGGAIGALLNLGHHEGKVLNRARILRNIGAVAGVAGGAVGLHHLMKRVYRPDHR